MKSEKKIWRGTLVVPLIALGFTGCTGLVPPPPEPPKVSHTLPTVKTRICGSLPEFVGNLLQLDLSGLEELRNELGGYHRNGFSCDQLKTGLLLGQTGVSISDDNLAIEILESYRESERLLLSERRLVTSLLQQVRQRKELHVRIHNQQQKIRRQESALREVQSQVAYQAEELTALQRQIDELKQLEEDINETEQSLSTPATTGIPNEEPTNSGS